MAWKQTRWAEVDAAQLRQTIYATLDQATYQHPIRKNGLIVDWETRPWSPDKHKMANVLEALAAVVHLASDIDAPVWINATSALRAKQTQILTATPEIDVAQTPPAQMISCNNGLLDLSTRTLHAHTPPSGRFRLSITSCPRRFADLLDD
jgi:putative DNA primase/helicase